MDNHMVKQMLEEVLNTTEGNECLIEGTGMICSQVRLRHVCDRGSL